MRAKVVAATMGFGMVIGSLVGGIEAGAAPHGGAETMAVSHYACDCEARVTTSALNLRSGPGTNYDVLLVMPEGAEVQMWLNPELHQNGFVKVAYDGNYGWAAEEYLAGAGYGGVGQDIVGTAVTNSAVNFRQGPGYDYDVQFVIADGAQVAITDEVYDGFRYIWHAGVDGWVYDEYLTLDAAGGPGDATTVGTAVTNDYVNFREGAGTSYAVVEVLSPGTAVDMTDYVSNGFRFVYVNGAAGWVHDDYLNPPDSLPNAPTTGTAATTDWVNFRVGPGTGYGVREVLAPGTEVETTDIVENGFHQVSVNGTMGWVHVNYLG